MRRNALVWVAILGVGALISTAGIASGSTGKRVFYLTIHPRECRVGTLNRKTVLVVPCSNPAHNFEVYAVGHGGWGHSAPPPQKTALALARQVCLSAYARITGHALPSTAGWQAFWPDPGAETARYGDKIICSYRTWPRLAALGAGWHVH
jgi:hypothetical protein